MKKKLAFKFFNKKKSVSTYSNLYKKTDFKKGYPANQKRLKIIVSLLKKTKPKKIIDSGCGAGLPLIKIKKLGFNIIGYDKSSEMVLEAKKNLKKNKLNTNLIFKDDFENVKCIKNNSVDCILGMGAFYYSKNIKKVLKIQKHKLKKNGRLIFSLRNKLFNIATMNDYSINFFSELYNIKDKDKKVQKKFKDAFKGFNKRKNIKLKNIDDHKVFSRSHNPLTIEADLLNDLGLNLKGIYFYHFHFLPPFFENLMPLKFRKESWKQENPHDWKGNFLSSGFVIDCIKKGKK